MWVAHTSSARCGLGQRLDKVGSEKGTQLNVQGPWWMVCATTGVPDHIWSSVFSIAFVPWESGKSSELYPLQLYVFLIVYAVGQLDRVLSGTFWFCTQSCRNISTSQIDSACLEDISCILYIFQMQSTLIVWVHIYFFLVEYVPSFFSLNMSRPFFWLNMPRPFFRWIFPVFFPLNMSRPFCQRSICPPTLTHGCLWTRTLWRAAGAPGAPGAEGSGFWSGLGSDGTRAWGGGRDVIRFMNHWDGKNGSGSIRIEN